MYSCFYLNLLAQKKKEKKYNIAILYNYVIGRWQAWESTFSSSFANQIFRFSSSVHSTKVNQSFSVGKIAFISPQIITIILEGYADSWVYINQMMDLYFV